MIQSQQNTTQAAHNQEKIECDEQPENSRDIAANSTITQQSQAVNRVY
jgi:hypothetical protein